MGIRRGSLKRPFDGASEDDSPRPAKQCGGVDSESDLQREILDVNRKLLRAMLAIQNDIAHIASILEK
jgi:hypothetical protein